MKKMLAIVAVAGLASAAMAQTGGPGNVKSYSTTHNPPLNIPDNNVAGVSSVIFVQDQGIIQSFDSVWIDMSHTWVGDLVITLSHPLSGLSTVIMDRPGVPASTFGNSDDVNGLYTFTDLDVLFPETAGSGSVAPGNYRSDGPLSRFNGDNKFGDWVLNVSDRASGDTGVIRAWGFSVTNVPTPGAFALLGLGGLAAARRRRA